MLPQRQVVELRRCVLDHETFEAAQRQLQANGTSQRAQIRGSSPSLLTGLIYDETGDRLCPTHARKQGRRYRYYISKRLMHRSPDLQGGWRLPAKTLKDLVVKAIAGFLLDEIRIVQALGGSALAPQRLLGVLEHLRSLAIRLKGQEPAACREILERLVHRITLAAGTLHILVKRASLLVPSTDCHSATKSFWNASPRRTVASRG